MSGEDEEIVLKVDQQTNRNNSNITNYLEAWFCVICLQKCDLLALAPYTINIDPGGGGAAGRSEKLKGAFETFLKYLNISEELNSLTSFSNDDDDSLFTRLFHCCQPCEASLRKLHDLNKELKLLLNETALISSTLTAKIIESSKNIRNDAISCRNDDFAGADSDIFSQQLTGPPTGPGPDTEEIVEIEAETDTKVENESNAVSTDATVVVSKDDFDLRLQPDLSPESDTNLRNQQFYDQSIPQEVRWFRRQVLNYYNVKVALKNVEEMKREGLKPKRARRRRSIPTKRRKDKVAIERLCKSEPNVDEDEVCLSDDNLKLDATFSPSLSDVGDQDVDFMLSVMLPSLSTSSTQENSDTFRKQAAKKPKRNRTSRIKTKLVRNVIKSNYSDSTELQPLQSQGLATKQKKFAGFVKTRKLRSKMYRETSPNKFLYADKFPFEKIEDGFKCGSCDFAYESSNKISPMVSHVREKHFMKKTNRPYYKSCKLVTIGPNKFLYRGKCVIEKIDSIYKCGSCDYSSEIRRLTCRHVRLQHFMTEKTKACLYCGKLFLTTDKQKLHESRHTDERPYICEICGKAFKIAQSLSLHKKTHILEAEKNKICEICGKKFAFSQVLKKHLVTHTGEKRFECPTCHTFFGDAGTLRTHRNTHENLKLYSCDLCGMKFSQSGSVHRHVRSVHKKIPRSDSKKTDKGQAKDQGQEGNDAIFERQVDANLYSTPTFLPYPFSQQFQFK